MTRSAILRWPRQRSPWLLLAGSALALEAMALFFQYGLRLDPCVLCIYQRVAVLGVLVAGLVAAVAPAQVVVRWLGIAVWSISAVWGLSLALKLVGIQENPQLTFGCSFAAEFPTWAKLDEWAPSVFAPTGMCGEIEWQFLNLSMAQWMVFVFTSYAAVAVAVVIADVALVSRAIRRRTSGFAGR